MSTTAGQAHQRIAADHRRRRRPPAARIRVRQDPGVRSVSAVRRFPQRSSRRLPGRLPVASAPRHRDHHLRAVGHRRARRQPGQPRRARVGRRAVDDRRQRHHPSGNAARRRARPHARLPALGQPAARPEDDHAPLPGRQRPRHPDRHRRRRHPRARDLRFVLGQARSGGRHCRGPALPGHLGAARAPAHHPGGARRTTPLPTSLPGTGTFRDASEPRLVATELVGQGETPVYSDVGNRSLVVFDRGDEITVQAGDEGIAVPARLGAADRRARRVARPDRDEHATRNCGRRSAEIRQGTFIKHP